MHDEMAMTQNVRRFLAAVRELNDRPRGVEGMAILWGEPGEGKTTTVAFACNIMGGVFLRANACWTITSMLAALSIELGLPIANQRAPMMAGIIKCLSENPIPIFIDEADYLFQQASMLDVMRDLYDMTGSPVIMIGMEEFSRNVESRGKFARRITQSVRFYGINADDARVLAETLSEVKLADDLLAYVHKEAKGNIGRMVTGIARIEQFGKLNALDTVTKKDWAARPLFYDQSRFARRR